MHKKDATPPAGGRQDHYAMQGDATHPATESATEPIPGERDATTLTHREPGAIATPIGGAAMPEVDQAGLMEPETRRLHGLEGGGTN
jgi:hypothetical protein